MWLFYMRFGPFFYNESKARQDKMFILTLLYMYILIMQKKFQVAKVASKQQF